MESRGKEPAGAAAWTGGAPKETAGHSVVSLTALAVIVAVCAILAVAKELFLPLALGMLIAFILTPVVNFLRRRGLRDTPAVILTVLAAAVLVGAFVLIVAYQLSQIGTNLPLYQGNVLSKVDMLLDAGKDSRIVSHLRGMIENISARVEQQIAAAGGAAPAADTAMKVEVVEQTSIAGWLTGVILPALTPVATFGLIFVVVVFALLERAALRDRLVQLIGGTNILATSRLLAEAGSRVSTYLGAQLLVNVIYAVPIWLGLVLIGVPNALFFGIVTLVMRFVPYLGSAISALLPLVMAFAVSPDWSLVLWTAVLFIVVELVTSNVIEPWFYGQRTGVSPLAVIVSAMFWTWLWGPLGLIIATPLTVCLVVIGYHVPSLRLFSIMLGDKPVLEESAQLYDRLLAGHAFAFTETAALTTSERYLSEYYDRTAIPALALAQADHEAGLLSEIQASRISRAAYRLIEDLETVVEDERAQGEGAGTGGAGTGVEGRGEAAGEGGGEAAGEAATLLNNGVLDGIGRRVAVLGARTALDDAAAEMVAQAMRAEGAEAIALPHRTDPTAALKAHEPETIVIASLDGTVHRAVGLRIRQLRRRLPGPRLGVALWPGPVGAAVGDPHCDGADFVAVGMEPALANAFSAPA
ncbi:AI-2E family transporter [Albidovulum sp.]|jgi:predicted PurR-regulated permease PerM|uniref:AI-2E family transporter n=1 Tax=Albidovulum sp. TaxID=1872424 RepID=UPI0039B85D91